MALSIDDIRGQISGLLNNPGSFSMTPGAKFALDTGLSGIRRQYLAKGMGDSGNVLAELTKYGTGVASQDYGNQMDRLSKLLGGEEQYKLGTDQNTNVATRNANDFSLGTQRNQNDYNLGLGDLASRNWNNQANYNLGLGRNAVDIANANTNWFNARTARGTAGVNAATAWDGNNRNWFQQFM